MVSKPHGTPNPDGEAGRSEAEWEPVSRSFSLKPLTLREEASKEIVARSFELRQDSLRDFDERRPDDRGATESEVSAVPVVETSLILRDDTFTDAEAREYELKEPTQRDLRERNVESRSLRWRRPGVRRRD